MSNQRTKYHCGTPGCVQVIGVSEVIFPVINDEGGIVFTCDTCQQTQGVRMLNPSESFYNLTGGRRLEYWVDVEEASMLAKHGLTVANIISTPGIRYQPAKKQVLQWPGTTHPLFEYEKANFESSTYAALGMLSDEINQHYKSYLNGWYVKRRPCDRTFVLLETELDGEVQRAIFSKNIDSESDLNNRDLLLVNHNGCDLSATVDGIYSKTACLEYLRKLLLRWKQLADAVVIVVPFVGYPFSGSDAKNLDLWKLLNTHTDAAKTEMVTRSAAFKLFKRATDQLAVPFAMLEEWDFLTDMTKVLNSDANTFLERSHAKFYTGIFADHVEVLSGSFNIHNGGPSLENISFRTYDKEKFKAKYLEPVKPGYVYPEIESIDAHFMVFRGGKFVTENVVPLEEFKRQYFLV